ncbi:hypothetical protein AVEN_148004-1 [Araneus ventricosus]|uniref:Uncharacterized protein n=1 Tax=Araneus ventricosus TaxID=182803 RepID=A0A4Y2H0M1_ARAVE|nr:hypothetical protein AVEN_100661-1 [Araneus ventricosus]GBM58613.1 hypothetical protein AVEN_245450-1 [Araneus ventricosus]GBM58628.1 hypothetical protein AVEN_36225-1 [Araneus ventricosus]GBM58645.1 hypothetical protein AVEN_148004-1 [Araneus ventricosus]
MVELFKHYNPILEDSNLVSISNGVVGDSTINCHMAKEEGIIVIKRTEGRYDTTSALFSYGKMKFAQILKNNPDLLKVIRIFKNPDVNTESVVVAGNSFLVALYGYSTSTSNTSYSNNVRYKCYMKSSFHKSNNMASLPPTEAAAHQHFL